MTTTFRIPAAAHNMRSRLSYASGLQSRGLSAGCELPLAPRNAASDTVPEVAAGA